MEDFRWSFHYQDNINTQEDIQIRTPVESINFVQPGTCIDDDAFFDDLSTKRPHDHGLLGTASSLPVVQLNQATADDFSPAVAQCWPKVLANVGDPAQTITCKTQANSLLSSRNSLLQATRSHGWKKAAAGRRGDEATGNGHVHKLVERERRIKMKRLCSTLISLLPEEYQKTKHPLSDQLLESVKYIRYLQDKVIELGKRRDDLNLLATVKPFSNDSCVNTNLQVQTFPAIRVIEFGSGIQVTANTFKDQINFSSLLMVLEEAGVDVVSATVSAINDKVFYSIQSKFSDFRHFDSAFLHGRFGQLVGEGNLPSNSII